MDMLMALRTYILLHHNLLSLLKLKLMINDNDYTVMLINLAMGVTVFINNLCNML